MHRLFDRKPLAATTDERYSVLSSFLNRDIFCGNAFKTALIKLQLYKLLFELFAKMEQTLADLLTDAFSGKNYVFVLWIVFLFFCFLLFLKKLFTKVF